MSVGKSALMQMNDADDFSDPFEAAPLLARTHMSFTQGEVSAYYAARVPKLMPARGGQRRGPCPVHNGKDNNFAVDPETGRWFCHSACGRGGDIVALEEALTGVDFQTAKAEVFRIVGRFETSNGTHGRRRAYSGIVATYDYTDESGTLLYQAVRYDPKDFKQRKPDGKGGWIWSINGVRRVLYRLPDLLKRKTEAVFVCEGEKDVHSLEAFGLLATCNAMGAGKWRPEYSETLRGRSVVILPDNDGPGRNHAATVAAALLSMAASVRIVEVPGLPAKGDITDWRDAGGTIERLRELIKAAAPLDAPAVSELRTQWGIADAEPKHQAAGARGPVSAKWPKPEPIQSELPPVEAFSEDLLPASFRSLVRDVTERMQIPMDYAAVVMVLCLAGVVNRRAIIQPKAHDTGWVVVPNLWGAIIAPPGFMKSPVIQAATRPLNQIQAEWRQEHEEALKDHTRAKEEHELRRAAWKEQFKASVKSGKAAPDRPEAEPEEPRLRRIIVNDATFESLHEIMNDNPSGVFVIRDELTGWWAGLDRQGREQERSFFLQAWNGDTSFSVDRIGRGHIHVEACCLSMVGGIQPGRLRSYLVDALKDGPSNDGLIQRFQLLVWPDTAPDWSYVDRAPDWASEQQAGRVFRKLVDLEAENPLRFCFSPDAQVLFMEWLAKLEAKVRGDELHATLISHLSKYRKLMPALAVLFELADRASDNLHSDTVSVEHTRQAAAWCKYLESHARRVYSCVVTPQVRAARELADKIKRRKVGADGFFSCRDVYLKGWSGLDTPEAVKQAATLLQDAGWVTEVSSKSGPSGGRPSDRYEVNPRVWE